MCLSVCVVGFVCDYMCEYVNVNECVCVVAGYVCVLLWCMCECVLLWGVCVSVCVLLWGMCV